MGKWAKGLFGLPRFSEVGLLLAGTTTPKFEEEALKLFDKKINSKDSVYHAHLVKKNNKIYPIVFNVYGAPAAVDVLAEMHDGGCKTVIFLGYAYGGFKNIEVGGIVIPNKSYHYEGIFHLISLDKKASTPDNVLKNKIETILKNNNIKYHEGINISVPAVTFQLKHANPEYAKINPTTVEMELAACFQRAKQLGMRSVGILIISDNRSTSIRDDRKKKIRHDQKLKVIKTIVDNIEKFKFPPLKSKKFNIDEHLASIIENPDDKINVYKNSK